MPLVSVIVPVWNTSRYLSQCLDSLLSQTLQDIEIIIVNDGSPDDSQKIIDRYREQDSRIKCVVHQQCQGLMLARQSGFDASQGDYIANVDSDDYVAPEMLQIMCRKALSENADIVQCGGKRVENGTVSSFDYFRPLCAKLSGDEIFLNFLRGKISYSLCNKIYKRDLWKQARVHLPDFTVKTEDVLFNACLTFKARDYVAIEDECYYYRIRPDSGFHDGSVDKVCYRAWSASHNAKVIEEMVAAERAYPFATEALEAFKEHYLSTHLGRFANLKNIDNELLLLTLEKCLGYIDWSDFVRYGFDMQYKVGRSRSAVHVMASVLKKLSERIRYPKKVKDRR